MSQENEADVPDWIEKALAFGQRRKPDPAEWARLSDLDQEFAVHFLVRDRKIVRIRGFLRWQEALEAAGLSE